MILECGQLRASTASHCDSVAAYLSQLVSLNVSTLNYMVVVHLLSAQGQTLARQTTSLRHLSLPGFALVDCLISLLTLHTPALETLALHDMEMRPVKRASTKSWSVKQLELRQKRVHAQELLALPRCNNGPLSILSPDGLNVTLWATSVLVSGSLSFTWCTVVLDSSHLSSSLLLCTKPRGLWGIRLHPA